MSGKLFIQIIVLMIIFVLIKTSTMCLAKQYCPIMKGMKTQCPTCAAKMAK